MAFLFHKLFFKPHSFFKETLHDDPSYFKLISIILLSWFVYSLSIFLSPYFDSVSLSFLLVMGIILISSVFSLFALLLLVFATHIWLKVFGSNKRFKDTLSIFAYCCIISLVLGIIFFIYSTLMSFSSSKVILILLILFVIIYFIYHTYVMSVGLSIYHNISVFRAFGAYILGFVSYALVFSLLFFIIMLLVFIGGGFSFLSPTHEILDYSNSMPSNSILPATDKTHPIIFSYIGSPAVLDGKINNNDKWNEGE